MTRRAQTPSYYADDKDVYDLLYGAKQRLSQTRLVELARERGICVSSATPRVQLLDYLARLPFSWPQLQRVLSFTESPDRAEKLTSARVQTDASVEEITLAAQAVREVRKTREETYSVKVLGPDRLRLDVQYRDFDSQRSRLLQWIPRELSVEVERVDGGYRLRHQANETASEIVSALLDELGKVPGKQVEATSITLAGIGSAKTRTAFFVKMMSSMKGFNLENVTSIAVAKIPRPPAVEPDDESDGDGGDTDENTAQLYAYVKRAALEGGNLLNTPEFKRLSEAGFFTRRTVWVASEAKREGIHVEFEAGFDDGENCTNFRYNVRGVYERNAQGEIKEGRSPAKPEYRAAYILALEDAAVSALSAATATPSDDDGLGLP